MKFIQTIFILIVVLILFFTSSKLFHHLKSKPSESPSPTPTVVTPAPSPTPTPTRTNGSKDKSKDKPSDKKNVKLSGKNSFSQIEKNLNESGFQIASCLNKTAAKTDTDDEPSNLPVTIKMKLLWQPTGEYKGLVTFPEILPETQECISAIVKQWKTAPHPGMQPFSYSTELNHTTRY